MGVKYRIVEDEFGSGKYCVQRYHRSFEAWLTDWVFDSVDKAEIFIKEHLKKQQKPKDPRLGKVYE